MWRLAALNVEKNLYTIWKVIPVPRHNVNPERIAGVLKCDSLVVDSRQFERLWPVEKNW
jgi:hypothetical protein